MKKLRRKKRLLKMFLTEVEALMG